jgi:hypothetical protein
MEKGWGKGAVLFIVLATLVVPVAGCGGGDSTGSEGGGGAHVNPDSGSTNGVLLDERVGTRLKPPRTTGPRKAAEQARCYLLRHLKPEPSKETAPDAPAPKYGSNPPTSGPYVEPPYQQADGAYLVMPELTDVVGSLNRGRMAIQYAPDLAESSQLELKGLYDTMYGGTLFFPNETMEFAVAATTWTNLLGCTSFNGQDTLDAIRAFGKATWGKYGNVPVKKSPPVGPTPAEPEESGKGE